MKRKIQLKLEDYLNEAQRQNVEPNFYLSLSYLTLSESRCWWRDGWLWIESDGWCLTPPLKEGGSLKVRHAPPKWIRRVWSDFDDNPIFWEGCKKEFLDWEYLFDPRRFLEMKGKDWEVFRKNVRKWPRHNPNWIYCSYAPSWQIEDLIKDWVGDKRENIEDVDLLIKFIWNNDHNLQIQRRYLFDESERLVAVNVWEENWKFINYRVCIIRPNEPFLSEFTRWLFYTDHAVINSGKMVNDGGTVNKTGLKQFKDKMNPIRIRPVYTWARKFTWNNIFNFLKP